MYDNRLEHIIDLLDAKRTLTDEELAQLMQDDEAMSVVKDICCMQQATSRRCNDEQQKLDVDQAWEQLSAQMDAEESTATQESTTVNFMPEENDNPQPSRKSAVRYMLYAIAGIAACALIVMGFYSYVNTPVPTDPHLVYEQTLEEDTSITMTSTSNDEPVRVKGESQNLAQSQSPQLRSKILQALGYATDDVPTERYTINIPAGKSYQMTLPDGTQVWLHAGSKLTYPTAFIDEERSVYLEGEAYFKVTHDPRHPFVINTDNVVARVLGTELNVSSYKNEPAHVALIIGKVVVTSKKGDATVHLVPGQGATLQADETSFAVRSENMDGYEYWRNGYIYYDDTPLEEVARAVGRWYNVSVVFDDLSLKNLKIRYFCERSESLHRAVEILNHFDSFQVKMQDGKLHIHR